MKTFYSARPPYKFIVNHRFVIHTVETEQEFESPREFMKWAAEEFAKRLIAAGCVETELEYGIEDQRTHRFTFLTGAGRDRRLP